MTIAFLNGVRKLPRASRLLAIVFALAALGGAMAFLALNEEPVGRVQGTVRLSDLKRPLAGVTITLEPSNPLSDLPTRRVTTNAQGKFTLYNVAVGTYNIAAASRAHACKETKISVEEGDTAILPIDLTRSEPDLNLMLHQRMFSTAERPHYSLSGYIDGAKPWGHDTAHLRLFQTRMSAVMQNPEAGRKLQQVGSSYDPVPELPSELLLPTPTSAAKLLLERDVRLSEADKEGFYYQKVDLGSLPPGLYLTDVKHQGKTVCGWLLVTNTALVVKRAGTQLVAYTVDMRSGVPLPECTVHTYRDGILVANGKTDSHGVAQLHLADATKAQAGGSSQLFTVAARGSDEAVIEREVYSSENGGHYVVHAYTDRPIYRPGQRIYFKGIVRKQLETNTADPTASLEASLPDETARYRVPANIPVSVELRNPNGDRLLDETYRTNRNGSFTGQVDLLKEAPTGSYTLVTSIGDEEHTTDIVVAAYHKPEFSVTVTPDKKRYTRGDTVTMTLNGQYFFGAPVAGAKVKYRVYSETDWAEEYADASDGEDDPSDDHTDYSHSRFDSYFGGSVTEGETVLDQNGKATIQFAAQQDQKRKAAADQSGPQAEIYTLSATVTEGVDREVEAEGAAKVTSGDFRLAVRPEGYVAMPGKPSSVTVIASDYKGQPLPLQAFTLATGYAHWHGRAYEYKAVGVIHGVTDRAGRAIVQVTPPRAGELELKAKAFDDGKRAIVSRASLWAASDNTTDLDTTYTDLSLLTDKRHYQPGQVARVLINSDHTGQSALLTIEGEQVYRTQVVPLIRHSVILHVPILATYGPNVTLSACYVQDKHFASSDAPLRVALPDSEIRVALRQTNITDVRIPGAPDSLPRYTPGANVGYDVQTTDRQGRPVACEFSFGVVDEAIYALREDQPRALREAFYPRRYNAVSTEYSFSIIYMGDADKSEPKIEARRKFEDTAAWRPNLTTDTNGHAHVTFTLPDNLTTWRVTVTACSLDTRVGRATDKFIEYKPFLVRLQTPRTLTQRDTSQITAIVHNETLLPQNAQVRLVADGLTVNGDQQQSLSLQSGSSGSVTWNVAANDIGLAKLRVTAWTTPETGRTRYTDGIELSLPVRAHGRERFTSMAGEIGGQGTKTETFAMEVGAVPGISRLTLRLTPSLADALTGGDDYLIGFPYGCVEQTMSRFLPDLLVQRALRRRGLHNVKRDADLPEMISEGLQRIYRMQHAQSGAWGWWEHDDDNLWMTAYVLYGLATARDNGIEISANVLTRGRQAGLKMIPKAKPQEKPFLLYALALAGERDKITPALQSLFLRGLSTENLGYVILTDKLLRRDPAEALSLLNRHVVIENGLRHWKSDQGYDSDTLTGTAVVLRALLAVQPDVERVSDVLRWLMLRRTGDCWENTRDTSWVLAALCNVLAAQKPGAFGGSVEIACNGQKVQTVALDSNNLRERELAVEVPPSVLKGGANNLELTRSGGDTPLFYTLQLRQTLATEDMPAINDANIAIVRDYLREEPKQTDGFRWDLQTEPTNNQLKQGDSIRVRLKLTVPRDMEYVLIEDPFPAGCEVAERGDASEVADWNYWWSSVDVRDDRIAFFARHLDKGSHIIEYHLRAQTPGSYHTLPTVLSGMYQPDLRGASAETRVTIQ